MEAAVYAGANAVYLGGKAFGARAGAKNFDREELARAVGFCHGRGVGVHVTVNTLLKDGELEEALEFVDFLCTLPVDAVLVQDMGLFSLLRQRAPALPLHASTQMSIQAPAGAALLEELGARRVVLARELSLEEIGEIAGCCQVELESFVHGALCMCVSGQCYLSAMLGGRSGNRGQCAQPCRLPFGAKGGTGHDLSLKDLSFITRISQLREAGVCSAKIEGRMKRPEYVAAAVAACRMAAQGEPVPQDLLENLGAVFSRSGFTDGYLTGRRGRGMFGTRRKEDVTAATEKVLAGLHSLYRGERRDIPVDLSLFSEENEIRLQARDVHGACFTAAIAKGEALPRAGEKGNLPAQRCAQQLEKTGGTPFCAGKIQVPPEGLPLSVAELNALRRQALAGLLERRSRREPVEFCPQAGGELPGKQERRQPRQAKELPLRACFSSFTRLCPQARDCKEIVLPVTTEPEKLRSLAEDGWPSLLLALPRAFFGSQAWLEEQMKRQMEAGFQEFLCGSLDAFALCRRLGGKAHGAFSLNIANSAGLKAFQGLGLATAEASLELSGRELASLSSPLPLGAMVYGRQALMLTRNCPLANSGRGCLNCREPGVLTDRQGKCFPVTCSQAVGVENPCPGEGKELLNSVPLWLGDQKLAVDFGVMRFAVENSVESGEILEGFRRGERPKGAYTRGLFRRGVL